MVGAKTVGSSRLAVLGLVLGAASVGACGFDRPADIGYRVGGEVSGVWSGGRTSLRLSVGDRSEVLEVADNAAFEFLDALDPGETYEVTVVRPPAHHVCEVSEGAAAIGTEDVDAVRVSCVGPSVNVSVSAPVEFSFDQSALSQTLRTSLLTQAIAVTVVADDATSIAVNGEPASSGLASQEIPLQVGSNSIAVDIVEDSVSRSFELVALRAGPATQHAYVKASNTGAFDGFGAAIAIDGDTLVVGARAESSASRLINGPEDNDDRLESGAAYVFRREGGVWRQEAYLKASNADASDHFGTAVAVVGDVVAVGAPGEDGMSGTLPECGAVYVFRRDGSTWQQKAILRPSQCSELKGFGGYVAASGDVIAVGGSGDNSDSVHVFRFVGSTWQIEDNVPWPVGLPAKVALDGDVLVVGSYDGSGVHVFRNFSGDWTDQHTLVPDVPGSPSQFGWDFGIEGDTIVVTDPADSSSGRGVDAPDIDESAPGSGAAYVFKHVGNAWVQTALLKASNSEAGDGFGHGVAISGEFIVVGAGGEDGAASGVDADQASNGASSAGAAYVFRSEAGSWSQVHYLKASNAGHGVQFGLHVCASPDSVGVGMPNEISGATGIDGDQLDASAQQSGAVYIFR